MDGWMEWGIVFIRNEITKETFSTTAIIILLLLLMRDDDCYSSSSLWCYSLHSKGACNWSPYLLRKYKANPFVHPNPAWGLYSPPPAITFRTEKLVKASVLISHQYLLLHSILFYSILFYSILFYSIVYSLPPDFPTFVTSYFSNISPPSNPPDFNQAQ